MGREPLTPREVERAKVLYESGFPITSVAKGLSLPREKHPTPAHPGWGCHEGQGSTCSMLIRLFFARSAFADGVVRQSQVDPTELVDDQFPDPAPDHRKNRKIGHYPAASRSSILSKSRR